ncbi:MAG TPA: SUMF1/EgtB/PvdO family nonheme iron enzyme [Thermoanaerobaculia bacterium]
MGVALSVYAPPAVIRIEGSWFVMGSDDGEDNERPLHRVWVDAFEIAAHQVTNAEYARFAPPPCREDPRFNDPQQPVVAVSWTDAMHYCEWLGGGFRLPAEAEWELAARGGDAGKRYPWGDDAPEDSLRQLAGPDRVASRAPNGLGLYDMCENVHEWCSDWYAADYYASSPDRNPRGPESGTRRASRGGSWRHRVKVTRCAARSSLPPELRYADYGLRVVR